MTSEVGPRDEGGGGVELAREVAGPVEGVVHALKHAEIRFRAYEAGYCREQTMHLSKDRPQAAFEAQAQAQAAARGAAQCSEALAGLEGFLAGGFERRERVGSKIEPLKAFAEGYSAGHRQGHEDATLMAQDPEGRVPTDQSAQHLAVFRARIAKGQV